MTRDSTEMTPLARLLWLGLAVLVVLSGLCTIFAAVVTATAAWQEHAEARWPLATARVERCALDQTSRKRLHRHCRLRYAVGGELNVTNMYSITVPPPNVWQYPPNQIVPLQKWMHEHPAGTSIAVHYDPDNHRKAALAAADMPFGRPRTPGNIKLLEFFAGSFLVLLVIARFTRPAGGSEVRSSPQAGISPRVE